MMIYDEHEYHRHTSSATAIPWCKMYYPYIHPVPPHPTQSYTYHPYRWMYSAACVYASDLCFLLHLI